MSLLYNKTKSTRTTVMLALAGFLFFSVAQCLSAAEITELQKLRTVVSVLNGGDITGLNLEWQTGDLSNACTFFGIFCTDGGNIEAMFTQAFFSLTSDNQIFAPSEIDYTKFPSLRQMIIRNRQMTGDFNLKLPSGLVTFRLLGDLSTSQTGGYTMVGALPENLFSSMNFLSELEIAYFPKLTGAFPSYSTLTTLTIFSVAHVGMTGPFPAIPMTNGRQIAVLDTQMSGTLPEEYCIALNSFYSEVDPNYLLIAENEHLTDLPNCVKTCTSSPIYSLCTIKLNNVCDVGQPLASDVTIDVGLTGALAGACVLGNDNPCTISRDNELCLDCTGNVDSGFTYDLCGVCNKATDTTRNACLDCLGIPFGTARYDICGVCEGSANTCYDCFGVPAGSAQYDICGVCEGHGASCDCAGVTGGTSVLDACGVCDGNNACYDCLGIPYGSTEYDVCGVCAGSGNTCDDCSGEPGGTKVYDACDVCGGDGSQCDCLGVHLGFTVLDACDVCGGDGSSCADCLGVPNGPAVYDVCDVCNGSDMVAPCENPPDDNSMVQEVERTSTLVFVAIIGVLTLLCLITMIVFAFSMKRKRTEPMQPKAHFDNSGPGGRSLQKSAMLFILSLALAPTPGECLLPQTTQFLESIAEHTNALSVYPEWFIGTNIRQFCSVSMPDLSCSEQDIDEVALTRPLIGSYGPSETQFVSLLPLASRISIKNSPQLQFSLSGIEHAALLKKLEIIDSGLYGTIPSTIGLCSSMTSLALSNTKLIGTLPVQTGQLTLLRNLTVSRSELSSISSVAFGNLNGVSYLDFRSNVIAEPIPNSIGQMENLVELRLANNEFNSAIPSTFCDLAQLKVLDLSANKLNSASVSPFGGGVCPLQGSLEILKLDRNLYGPRLPNLSGYSKLKHIGLSHNSFSSDFNGVDGFYYGETGALPLVVLVNNNEFRELRAFASQPFFGECNFTSNFLCTDSTGIDSLYFASQCDLGLRTRDCLPGLCGDVSCHDCLGRPHGTSVYDVCDVCAGSGTTCFDCNGVPNGPAVYDACHVCNGDDSSCADCSGVPNGSKYYDACDVCDGDGSSCADCAGVAFGLSVYDACDVCNGRGHTCLDCLGVFNGTSKFDECGVCNGDGLSCADPLIIDYLTNHGSFTLFVFLAVLLALLVVVAGVLLYLICSL